MIEKPRSELGDFLRSRRARLSPEDVGLTNGRRRRITGLRREEVAELAGIGVDWYIRLEQGRSVNPSATTIDALARALRLSKVEHGHLRALTRSAERRAFKRESVPEALRRLVNAMVLPAYVTGRRWDVLAWNSAADDLFGFDKMDEDDRNTLLMILVSPGARRLLRGSWADEAKRMIAQFRPIYDVWADDPAFRALYQRLRSGCPEFADWWKAHDVRGAGAGEKRIHHPKKGLLRFEHASFQSTEDATLRLIVYTSL
jgi:transcriptional regulator with XRE-family HTH domain